MYYVRATTDLQVALGVFSVCQHLVPSPKVSGFHDRFVLGKEGTQDIWKRCHRSTKMADTSKGAKFYIIFMFLVLSQQTFLILHVLATSYGMMGVVGECPLFSWQIPTCFSGGSHLGVSLDSHLN